MEWDKERAVPFLLLVYGQKCGGPRDSSIRLRLPFTPAHTQEGFHDPEKIHQRR